jgi:hypothetical protein
MGAYLNGVMICGVNEKLYLFGNNTDEIAIYDIVNKRIKTIINTGSDTLWVPITGILAKRYILCTRSDAVVSNSILCIDLEKEKAFAQSIPSSAKWAHANVVPSNFYRSYPQDGTSPIRSDFVYHAIIIGVHRGISANTSPHLLIFKSGKFTIWNYGYVSYSGNGLSLQLIPNVPWAGVPNLQQGTRCCYLDTYVRTNGDFDIRLWWFDEQDNQHTEFIPYPDKITGRTIDGARWAYTPSLKSYDTTRTDATDGPGLIRARTLSLGWDNDRSIKYFIYDIISHEWYAIAQDGTRLN